MTDFTGKHHFSSEKLYRLVLLIEKITVFSENDQIYSFQVK